MKHKHCYLYSLKHLVSIYLTIQISISISPLVSTSMASMVERCTLPLGPEDSLLVSNLKGSRYASYNIETLRIPASTIKLLTSLVAIRLLGSNYRFKTDFFLDKSDNLIMKGYGDPLLVSEVLSDMALKLSKKIKQINHLVVDDSFFERPILIPGKTNSPNPYDAPIGAVSANFNTVFFKMTREGDLVSAEPQTPLLPFARQKILAQGWTGGRYTLSHEVQDPPRYAGELMAYFLKKGGVKMRGEVKVGLVQGRAIALLTYLSPFTLEEVIAKMLNFSNNFMANQLLVHMGGFKLGPPATLSKGLKVVRAYAMGRLGIKRFRLVEGSGISRKNKISALEMFKILHEFFPFRRLLRRDGTMLSKSGTLRGIKTLAGYLECQSPDNPLVFVIFTVGEGNKLEKVKRCLIRVSESSEGLH